MASPVQPFQMAPMAGVTDPAFRLRLRRGGCSYLFTEMVSATALARGNRRTLSYLEPPDRGPDLAVQLFGANPDELAEAARRAQEMGFGHVDLNMGCPVRKVVRSGAGAALLRDPARAEQCLRALRAVVRGTLSVKIRSGWDATSRRPVALGRLAEACGVDRITLHPRTRAQGYGGEADWGEVAALAAAVSVPVVGNGDVADAAVAVARLRGSGCAGVMIGRAALGRPWVFREAEYLLAGRPLPASPTPAQIGEDLLRQTDDLVRFKGEPAAAAEMKKFAAWGARGLPGATAFRRRVHAAADLGRLQEEVRRFFWSGSGGEGVGRGA